MGKISTFFWNNLMQQEYFKTIDEQIEKYHLILATFSGALTKQEASKVTIRFLTIKGQPVYQLTELVDDKAYHENLTAQECLEWISLNGPFYKQAMYYTQLQDYQVLRSKKGQLTLLKKPPSKVKQLLTHNREKKYILAENQPIPFLIHVGIMNASGAVYTQKRDKFRQINRFLEMIEDILPALDASHVLNIIDFGCGKAYLTFALYHFLVVIHNFRVQITGLDLKAEVIQECQLLTKQLGYQHNLQFILGDINTFEQQKAVDLMVSLHACDTATDAALEKAVQWNAQVILSVPCCQHELYSQVNQQALKPLLKHGILKERFAALVTDAARAQLLEVLGYQTQLLEFIDLEHTPKNLLIRAIKKKKLGDVNSAWKDYLVFKQTLNIYPSLEKRFEKELTN
jgi:SAM-dependent methyltransferase